MSPHFYRLFAIARYLLADTPIIIYVIHVDQQNI